MKRELRFTPTADAQLESLEADPARKDVLKQVRKTLGYLETNPRHPSLQTHEYHSLTESFGVKVFEAYVQHKVAAAYRVFFPYGPDEQNAKGKRIPVITVVAITPHP